MIDRKLFPTKDFKLAAALMASGKRLQDLRWKGTVAFFIFEDYSSCSDVADSFTQNELVVKAWEFACAMNELKMKLFAKRPMGDL